MHPSLESLYAGEITPRQAFTLLEGNAAAVLVDVRTPPEWSGVGYPDLSSLGKNIIRLSWRVYPAMQRNASFEEQLTAAVPDPGTPLLFLCRSGGRSLDAAIAMTACGYSSCYNITDGFEGTHNSPHGTASGWKAEALPWRQD